LRNGNIDDQERSTMAPQPASPLRVADEFWLRENVCESLRDRDIGALFRLLRRYAGASQTQIGSAVGLEQGYVSKVMNGQRDVSAIDLLDRIASGIGMPDHCRVLLGLAPRDVTWRQAMVGISVGSDTRLSYPVVSETSGEDSVRRREFPTLTGAAIAAPVAGLPLLEQVENLRQGLNDAVGAGSVADAGLDDWEQTAARYGEATRYRPSGILLLDLTADFAELRRVLGLRHPSSALRRLTRVAAQLAGLMSLTLIKLDARVASRNWARTARLAADEAGEASLQSWVRAQEAYAHYYSGDFAEAVNASRQAQTIAWRCACVGTALAAALARLSWLFRSWVGCGLRGSGLSWAYRRVLLDLIF
jgi:uncharacterized membrane protein YecN with MAPEG domain